MDIRVAVADDNALLLDGLKRLISATDGLELVGAASNHDELLSIVEDSEPNVVVTYIRMPPTGTDEGIRAASSIRASHPGIGVIVLSQYVSLAYAVALLSEGSERRGYLLKDRDAGVDDLVAAIRVVAAGGAVIDPKVVEQLVNSTRSSEQPIDQLTPREREVLGEIAQGKSNAAVARPPGRRPAVMREQFGLVGLPGHAVAATTNHPLRCRGLRVVIPLRHFSRRSPSFVSRP